MSETTLRMAAPAIFLIPAVHTASHRSSRSIFTSAPVSTALRRATLSASDIRSVSMACFDAIDRGRRRSIARRRNKRRSLVVYMAGRPDALWSHCVPGAAQMRTFSKQDVDEAWEAWASTKLATHVRAPLDDALTPNAAVRMLGHQRFSSAFCDYVLQNEPERIVEVTRLDVIRALNEQKSDLEAWREDWEILPDFPATGEGRRDLA